MTLDRLTGTLTVSSEPPGATVRSQETKLGETPLMVTLPVSELDLEVSLDGFVDQQRHVAVTEAAETRLAVKLVRSAMRSTR